MPKFISSGEEIYYEIEGEGPVLILQTGAAGDSNMWRHAGYLKGLRGFKKILVDHRGHGHSGKPIQLEHHRIECYVSDVLTMMDTLDIERSAFVGYSDGGRVGFELAISHPDRITHLVSLGSIGSMDEEERQGRESLADTIRANGVQSLIGYFEEAEGIRFPEWLCDQFRTTNNEIFALEMLAWETWRGAWDRMAEIQVPVMMIVGEGEDPDGLAHEAAKILPKGKAITLAGKGHLGAFLAADEVLSHIIPFIA